MVKLKIDTKRRLLETGMHIGSLWQPPSMFPNDGRKLKEVAQPGDPWVAQLFYPDVVTENGPCRWYPLFISWGQGDTADAAVHDAIEKASGLQGCIRKLTGAIESLLGVLGAADRPL